CNSIALVNGSPQMGSAPLQTKQPALPPAFICFHSSSRIKFSYWRVVRNTPVGTPVDTMMPSRTENVLGAQFTLVQPVKSRPLKRGVQSSAASAMNPETRKVLKISRIRLFYCERCGPNREKIRQRLGALPSCADCLPGVSLSDELDLGKSYDQGTSSHRKKHVRKSGRYTNGQFCRSVKFPRHHGSHRFLQTPRLQGAGTTTFSARRAG